MITNSTVTVPTIPEISPTTTPPATPTPTAVYEVDEHSSTTGHVNSHPSVGNRKLLILRYTQYVGGGCVVAKYSSTTHDHFLYHPYAFGFTALLTSIENL